MRVIGIVDGQVLEPETVNVSCSSTLQQLHDAVSVMARERLASLGQEMGRMGRDVGINLFTTSAVALEATSRSTCREAGLGPTSTVYATVSFGGHAPSLHKCEPPFGSCAGGNTVYIHGAGFTAGQHFHHLRVAFGADRQVPATRVSDHVLECVAPPHPAGPVTVRLLCASASAEQRVLEPASKGAPYEFVEPELMYDAIFASTNSHCPTLHVLRGRAEEKGDEVGPTVPRWGSL